MTPETMAHWARVKGIDLLGTGDFTHPEWMKTLRQTLSPVAEGIYEHAGVRFLLSVELSVLWRHNDKGRRVHLLVLVPSLDAAAAMTRELDGFGKLASDGRPMLKASAQTVVEAIWSVAPDAAVIPAHVWTPWYAVFGAKSGFDSLEECFGPHAKRIHSIETGLSSDPAMNRRVSALDRLTLVSNSDAHSPSKLGREATCFDLPELTYPGITRALETGNGYVGTIEFYPQEGKYHLDGHRACSVSMNPSETQASGGLCPVCGKPVTVGTLHRISTLADRSVPGTPPSQGTVDYLVPLAEVLSQVLSVGVNTKRVARAYGDLIDRFGSEFSILLDRPIDELADDAPPQIVEAIAKMRKGDLTITPGYDGVYGTVEIPLISA